jgi:hypothetical protein
MVVEHYESESDTSRVPRRARSLKALRRGCSADSFCPAFHTRTSGAYVQEEVSRESKSQRTQTKNQTFNLGPRFPRHGLVDGFRFSHLTGEFLIGQPLPDNLPDANIESFSVGHLTGVVAERLFIEVPEKVERLHADVGSVQATLNKTPVPAP